jgi:hypothetical protein
MIPLAGLLYGAATVWVFGRFANAPAMRAAANRIQAHLLEFWLYVDEPRAIWQSWKGLLAANARLLSLLLVPILILSIPSVALFIFLDQAYGTSPLPVGKPTVVTFAFDGSRSPIPQLTAPDGISVETPPVRVASLREVSWRIRPLRAMSGELSCDRQSQKITVSDSPPYHWSVWFLVSSVFGAILARYFARAAAMRSRS